MLKYITSSRHEKLLCGVGGEIAFNGQGLLSVQELELQMFKNLMKMNNEKTVEANNVKPALQQTQCTTLREGLEQMLIEAKKQCVETKGMLDSVWHTANVKKIENVIKLIDEYQPVA